MNETQSAFNFLKSILLDKSNHIESMLKAYNYNKQQIEEYLPKSHAELNKWILHLVESLPAVLKEFHDRGNPNPAIELDMEEDA